MPPITELEPAHVQHEEITKDVAYVVIAGFAPAYRKCVSRRPDGAWAWYDSLSHQFTAEELRAIADHMDRNQ